MIFRSANLLAVLVLPAALLGPAPNWRPLAYHPHAK
jgi:hypothetical protein